MNLAKTMAMVTGGASGAGKATAEQLAKQGAHVVILDIDNKGQDVASAIGGDFYQVDLSQAEPLEQVFQECQSKNIPLRVCVNCAGIAPPSRMTGKDGAKPLSFFENVINVNLIGSYNMMRLSADWMSKLEPLADNQRGVIIHTASIAAFEGQIGQTAYSASKAGIVGMTLPAARELAQFGIRVVTVAPGLVDTPMLQGLPAEYREALETNTPYPKRFAKVEEYASLIDHIVDNTMINGEVIRLDGALRMQPS